MELSLPKMRAGRVLLGVAILLVIAALYFLGQRVLLRRIAADTRTLKGTVPKPKKSISVETMNLAIAKMDRT